jgi:hypothetical protein
MPRKVADLVRDVPELLKKLSYPPKTAKELRAMGAKELRKLEIRLLKEEEEEEEGLLAETAHLPLPSAKLKKAAAAAAAAAAEAPAAAPKRRKLRKGPLVTAEEAKVLDQTTSAFLPEAIAASTQALALPAPRPISTLPKAEVAVASVGIQATKASRPKKAKDAVKEKVGKEVKEAEATMKILEAEKKGLLKSKEAKAKARELRYAQAMSEEGAEMNVKEGAMKAKALLGKVKEKVVGAARKRKAKAEKPIDEKALPPGLMSPRRKTPLRSHTIAVESVTPPALGHPQSPAVPKQHSHSLSAAVKQLGRVGISL